MTARAVLRVPQALAGPLINSSYLSRGYTTPSTSNTLGAASGPPVQVWHPSGYLPDG